MATLRTPLAVVTILKGDGSVVAGVSRDLLALQTQKALGQASGNFVLRLAARVDAQRRTYLDRIDAMDYIELRLGWRRGDGLPPVLMRGYVDSVTEDFAVADDGTPQRSILVNGEDMGKGLLTKTLWVPPNGADTGQYGTYLNFYNQWTFQNGQAQDAPRQAPSPSVFFDQYLKQLYDAAELDPPAGYDPQQSEVLQRLAGLRFACTLPDNGGYHCFLPTLPRDDMGSLWGIATTYQSAPFSEVFVVDREDAPYLLWRLPPFYDHQGNFLAGTGARPPALPAPGDAVDLAQRLLASSLTKAEADVVNFVLTSPQNVGGAASSAQLAAIVPGNPAFINSSIARFGFRSLQTPVNFVFLASGVAQDAVDRSALSAVQVCVLLTDWAIRAFGDNDQLLSGQLTTVGLPGVAIGDYLAVATDPRTGRAITLPDAGIAGTLRCYVEGVSHTFNAETADWRTTFQVSRGARVR